MLEEEEGEGENLDSVYRTAIIPDKSGPHPSFSDQDLLSTNIQHIYFGFFFVKYFWVHKKTKRKLKVFAVVAYFSKLQHNGWVGSEM